VDDPQFFYDFGSPNAYLSHKVLPAIEARTGARFRYVPVLLGGVFKLTGNQSPMAAFAHVRNKPEYERLEMARFVRKHGLDHFAPNPHFPVNTLRLMRGAVAAQTLGVASAYIEAMFAAMWERGLKMDDPAVWRETMVDAGLPADELLRLSQTDAVKAGLITNTEAAVEAGAFGSPTFLVGGELFFGKDRLDQVEAEIMAARAGAWP
jgi:2-hydroxychromene-2-carboxylate isomerase